MFPLLFCESPHGGRAAQEFPDDATPLPVVAPLTASPKSTERKIPLGAPRLNELAGLRFKLGAYNSFDLSPCVEFECEVA